MKIEKFRTKQMDKTRRIRNGECPSVSFVNKPRKLKIRVMSNIAKPWWGSAALTPNLWRD